MTDQIKDVYPPVCFEMHGVAVIFHAVAGVACIQVGDVLPGTERMKLSYAFPCGEIMNADGSIDLKLLYDRAEHLWRAWCTMPSYELPF